MQTFSSCYLTDDRWATIGSQCTGTLWSGQLDICTQSDSKLKVFKSKKMEEGGLVSMTVISSKSPLLAVGSVSGCISTLDPTTFETSYDENAHHRQVSCLDSVVVDNQPSLLSGSWDLKINQYNVHDDGSLTLRSSSISHHKPITGVCWNADGKQYASCSLDGDLKLWDNKSKSPPTLVLKPTLSGDQLFTVDWSKKDQNLVAVGCDSCVVLYDLRSTSQPLVSCKTGGSVKCLKFDPHQSRLACGVTDYTSGHGKLDVFSITSEPNKLDLMKSCSYTDFINCISWNPKSKDVLLVGGAWSTSTSGVKGVDLVDIK
eukprot:TRINITY_DN1052_c0_g1_i1.p1 TRINITY_DN1052_c0_g1~~TRINITY_DN1052_c0_g1_i1.p1  ORF type:complete len:316 (-),score=40.82 TRINITY_DN1052_c0_g1_i1:188-1135(-)